MRLALSPRAVEGTKTLSLLTALSVRDLSRKHCERRDAQMGWRDSVLNRRCFVFCFMGLVLFACSLPRSPSDRTRPTVSSGAAAEYFRSVTKTHDIPDPATYAHLGSSSEMFSNVPLPTYSAKPIFPTRLRLKWFQNGGGARLYVCSGINFVHNTGPLTHHGGARTESKGGGAALPAHGCRGHLVNARPPC